MSIIGDQLIQSMREAVDYARGEAETTGYRIHSLPVDVRGIRKRLGMTQKHFATEFGFSLDTLRHWEQHRRTPEGPAKAYLLVIAQKPDEVRQALKEAMRPHGAETSPAGKIASALA